MPLAPGTQIGPYRIIDQIGAGGMGEVYRATDTKLGRDIAIKTLPSALAQEPDRLARFEREAKLLASLNHAHIGAIYGLDEHEGTQFIAMELVEGQTLAEKLKDGPLRVEDALHIGLQIAEALEAAHEKGVVHRDLKPANVMLTPDGVVKVLDFGLAKAFSGDPNEASPAHSPALSVAMTQQGLILGTAGYMSPEQASGQGTDQRADIWAFGVVLYEMLTGLPLFSGESVPHILAAVLQTEPDWNRLPKNVDPRLKLLLERCLEKKPRNRYHGISDARVDIERILKHPEVQQTYRASDVPSTRPLLASVAASVALTVAIMGLLAWNFWPVLQALPVDRFDYDLPEDHALRGFQGRHIMALSPDGRYFVYETTDGLYLRPMGELEAQLIPGTEAPLTSPVFSPDGRWVAYWDGQLKRVAISGGAPVLIAESPNNPLGLSWAADGTIFFGQSDGIYRVAANGGTAERIIDTEEGKVPYGPELLPDGDTVLFSMGPLNTWDGTQTMVESLSTGERTVLDVAAGGSDVHYLPTGHLVYALADSLFAVAFDLDTLTVSGGAVPLVQGVMRTGTGAANYSVSQDGRLVYARGAVSAQTRTLVWVDRDGGEESIAAPPRAYTSPRISPDGTKVVLNARDQDQDLWVWDFARKTLTRLTFDPGQDRFPVWSPDGEMIAYSSERTEGSQNGGFTTTLDWRAADGTGAPERLFASPGQIFPHSFLPDGSGVLAHGDPTGGNGNDDIALYSTEGEDSATALLETSFNELMPDVSPDGRWLAYISDESGIFEIYVRPFPDINAGRWQVSTGGGTEPLWARDGETLFYRGEEALMAVPVEIAQGFAAGNPEVVFEGSQYSVGLGFGGRSYDTVDGERFLMIRPFQDASSTTQFIVVLNWLRELERLVPTAE